MKHKSETIILTAAKFTNRNPKINDKKRRRREKYKQNTEKKTQETKTRTNKSDNRVRDSEVESQFLSLPRFFQQLTATVVRKRDTHNNLPNVKQC